MSAIPEGSGVDAWVRETPAMKSIGGSALGVPSERNSRTGFVDWAVKTMVTSDQGVNPWCGFLIVVVDCVVNSVVVPKKTSQSSVVAPPY
jgi:hypothetical protein